MSAQRVADRYMIRQAVALACQGPFKTASMYHREVVQACLEGALMGTPWMKTATLTGLLTKAKKLMGMIKSAPKLLDKIKDALGIKALSELPQKLKEMAQQGFQAIRKALDKIKSTFPVSLYFAPKTKMPGLTDLLQRIVGGSPAIGKALNAIGSKIKPIDAWLEKYAPNLSRPLKAAAFAWVWINVAEISWDLPSLWDGFTGKISLSELFASLPESGIGAVLALFGVGYHLLPLTFVARLLWLVSHKYLSWKDGKLIVHWGKIRPEDDHAQDEAFAMA